MLHVDKVSFLISFIIASTTVHADTITLAPGSDIQSAVDGLEHGDVVQLEPGVYEIQTTLQLGRKAIQFNGAVDESGNPISILDGGNASRIVEWGIPSDPDQPPAQGNELMVFANLVFTAGHASGHGGAMALRNEESPLTSQGGSWDLLIHNCIFRQNHADLGGGAVHVSGPAPLFQQCLFLENGSHDRLHGGGAVYSNLSFCDYVDCVFRDNEARHHGGAIRSLGGFDEFGSCVFESNQAGGDGGAICRDFLGSTTYLEDCRFSANRSGRHGGHLFIRGLMGFMDDCLLEGGIAAVSGGAVYLDSSIVTDIQDCQFVDNQALAGEGGAMYLDSRFTNEEEPFRVKRCSFEGNRAVTGGAILNHFSDGLYSQSTFSGNTATNGPGGASHHLTSDCTYRDCEFTGNESSSAGGALSFVGATAVPLVRNCLIAGNLAPSGGGISNVDSQITIWNSTICSNQIGQLDPGTGWSDAGGNTIRGNCNCRADFDGNGTVDAADLGFMLQAWGKNVPECDIDGDGIVGAADLGLFFADWGVCE